MVKKGRKNKGITFKSLSKWEAVVILLIGLVLSIVFMQQTISRLSGYIPVSDETTNINRLESIYECGIPYSKPPKTSVHYRPDVKYKSNFQYAPELYLRYPFYHLGKHFDYEWRSVSSLFYLYLIFIGILLFKVFKTSRVPIVCTSFLILFIALSPWSAASFHYVRYYPFLLIAVLVSHYICVYLYEHEFSNEFLKYAGILAAALLPVFIHAASYSFFIFWLLVVVWLFGKSIRANFSRQKMKPYLLGVLGILAVLILFFATYGRNTLKYGFARLQSPEAMAGALQKFVELNFNLSAIGIIFTLFVIIGGVMTYKCLIRYEKRLLVFGVLYFFFGTFFLSLFVGDHFKGYQGANRYYFLVHGIYLLVFSICLTGIYRLALNKLPEFKAKPIAIFVAFTIPFIFSAFTFSTLTFKQYNFSINPRIPIDPINGMKANLEKYDYIIVGNYRKSMVQFYFPDNEYYSMAKVEGSLRNAQGKLRKNQMAKLELDPNYVGTPEKFCAMLEKNQDKGVFFFYIQKINADKELWRRLSTLENFKNRGFIPVFMLQDAVCN